MKTLILEPDAMRARSLATLYGGATQIVHVAQSAAQARLMLLELCYDRFCLPLGGQSDGSFALLSVVRAMNPDCEIVDLTSKRSRLVTGPMLEASEAPAPFTQSTSDKAKR